MKSVAIPRIGHSVTLPDKNASLKAPTWNLTNLCISKPIRFSSCITVKQLQAQQSFIFATLAWEATAKWINRRKRCKWPGFDPGGFQMISWVLDEIKAPATVKFAFFRVWKNLCEGPFKDTPILKRIRNIFATFEPRSAGSKARPLPLRYTQIFVFCCICIRTPISLEMEQYQRCRLPNLD